MTPLEKQAYEWALNQKYESVSARYARILAQYIEREATRLTALTAERDSLRALVERVNEIGPNLRIDTFVQGNWTIQHLKLVELLKDCQRTK